MRDHSLTWHPGRLTETGKPGRLKTDRFPVRIRGRPRRLSGYRHRSGTRHPRLSLSGGMADTLVLGTSALGRVGSTPTGGTPGECAMGKTHYTRNTHGWRTP